MISDHIRIKLQCYFNGSLWTEASINLWDDTSYTKLKNKLQKYYPPEWKFVVTFPGGAKEFYGSETFVLDKILAHLGLTRDDS